MSRFPFCKIVRCIGYLRVVAPDVDNGSGASEPLEGNVGGPPAALGENFHIIILYTFIIILN